MCVCSIMTDGQPSRLQIILSHAVAAVEKVVLALCRASVLEEEKTTVWVNQASFYPSK